jgi:hypothetical protein
VCFYATPLHGTPAPDHDETSEAAWIDSSLLASLPVHPSMRLRIDQAVADPTHAHLG